VICYGDKFQDRRYVLGPGLIKEGNIVTFFPYVETEAS
jgi:hypothetical protein